MVRSSPRSAATSRCRSLRIDDPPTKRARDLGIPFDGTPGPLNAITDVDGVEVLGVLVQANHGSIIVLVATDAPLLPHRLQRLVHRVPIGIGRLGGLGGEGPAE